MPEPPGPYNPLRTTGMEEETIKIKKLKIGKCNTKFKLKKNIYIFFKQKIHHKPACEVESV
jgi:hypothetical protein